MTLIASFGIVITAAALFIVLSGFGGLKNYSLKFTSFVDPDLKLLPKQGKSFVFTEDKQQKLTQIDGIKAFSKVIEERVIIRSENKNVLATLKGVDANYLHVTQIDSMLTQGNWVSQSGNHVVSGWGIANKLAFGIYNFIQPLSIYVPKPGKGQLSSIKNAYNAAYVNNIGLFEINEQLDNEYIFSNIEMAKTLLGYQNQQYSAIELKLAPNANENEVIQTINTTFNEAFEIKNRAALNDALHKMLNSENLFIYLFFILVIIIALFNVIGALIMMILDKKPSLNTLFNLGAEVKTVKRIFFLQGSLMVIISSSIGVALGVLLVWLQLVFKMVPLTPEQPYPVVLSFTNIFIVLVTIFVLGILASKLASQRITRDLVA